jgi:hypothetical protein
VNGWVGATEGGYNTRLYFCKVPAAKFKPLSTVDTYQWHYAVLNLGTCPANSTEFERFIDNQDGSGNINSNSGNIAPNYQDRNTTLRFCLFRNGSSTMSSFPNLGFSYGIFASNTYFDPSLTLAEGWAYSDDEDTKNANGYTPPCDPYPGYPNGTHLYATQIIGAGSQGTRFNMVKVR